MLGFLTLYKSISKNVGTKFKVKSEHFSLSIYHVTFPELSSNELDVINLR